MQAICDLDQYAYSIRHGSYGGIAGAKDGILINGEMYLVKFPKASRCVKVASTSPLSEYVGSHIYEILGYDVHKTLLGIRRGKVAVACKDFCAKPSERLLEMRTLKNGANEQLEELLEQEMHYSPTGERVNLNELLLHLKYNMILQKIPNISNRFLGKCYH